MPDVVSGLSPGWLVLGVVLHVANQVARGSGWCAVIRTTTEAPPRTRDAVAAWVAGAGAGGVVSARGGDAVRVLLLARRMPGRGTRALLTGTLVAEAAGETALGLGLLAFALAIGVGPDLSPDAQTGLIAAAALLTLTGAVLLARRHERARGVLARVKTGCAALKCPRTYARHVLPWQLLSRVLRLAALACLLAAFHLPATLAAVLLVTFAQCSGRLVPFGPASVGTGAAILAATFGPVTGQYVPASQLAAFFVGTSTVLTVVGTALALVLCATQAGATDDPWMPRRRRPRPWSSGRADAGRVLRGPAGRAGAAHTVARRRGDRWFRPQASANAGPKLAGAGRLTRIRAAMSTRP